MLGMEASLNALIDAVRDAHLPLDVAGLALLVDEQADDRGAVLARQLHDPVEAAALALELAAAHGVSVQPVWQQLSVLLVML